MRRLYLLRHAKSSWEDRALADYDRPLAPRGRKATRRLGKYLEAESIAPELVLCSPAIRARETVDGIAWALPATTRVALAPRLYGAGRQDLYAALRSIAEDVATLMLVGHNPGLQELALSLARSGGDLERLREKFPTAALAILVLDRTWAELAPDTAVLERLVVPRELV